MLKIEIFKDFMLKRTPFVFKLIFTAIICGNVFATTYAGQACKTSSIKSSTPNENFTDHGNGTITHKATGLMWKRCGEGQTWTGNNCTGTVATFTWQNALAEVKTKNDAGFAGKKDWRLPNIKELASIIETQCYGPSINAAIFPGTPVQKYWTSSPSASQADRAWYVDFDGTTNTTYSVNAMTTLYAIRMVRDAQ